jgi:undecaprenyl-phosphate 4-deoxy-4-formamido-L-arabinose transferase
MVKKRMSVVVPVYKSQECVSALANKVRECLNDMEYELILVNDCSPDNSWKEIKKVAQSNRSVIGVNLRKNAGQDNAIMAGFSRASGEYVVVMDDDLQHDPKDIPRLVNELENGDFDVCFAEFVKKKQRLWKNFGSWFNGKMAEIVLKKPRGIYLSPFKVIKREIVDEILKYNGPYPYIDGIIFSITQNVTQFAAQHQERFAGESNYTVLKSIAVWLKLMTNYSVFPLRIATLLGVLASIVGFVLAIFYFGKYFLVGERVEGWTSLMVVGLIIAGTILVALGAIGEYVGRSYIQLNQRPQYCVKEVLRADE